jgi:hypothetical protein
LHLPQPKIDRTALFAKVTDHGLKGIYEYIKEEAANLVGRILTVKPGVYQEVEGLKFETVPAYNILKPFHPKGAEWGRL